MALVNATDHIRGSNLKKYFLTDLGKSKLKELL